ncbi:MAG: azurin [Rhodanobacter sp.]
MNTKMTVLALACALALSACSDNSSSPAASTAAPATTTTAPMEAPAAAASTPAMTPAAPSAAVPAAGDKPAAVVNDCATEIEGNDAMQYNVSSIVVPASCKDFKLTLKHTGSLPVTSMGHDVVISKAADMKAVDAAGMTAGAGAGYVKADDPQVIAHTKLIGAGETTSVSFPVSKIQGDGPYAFFCSFPGHSVLMHGSISVK